MSEEIEQEIARILAMSDEEILAEARASGEDPDENAAKLRALFEGTVDLVNKLRENPCPVCGKPGEFLKGDRVVCSDIACSPLALPIDVWVRLSKATALWRAVDTLESSVDGLNFNRYQDRWMARAYTLTTYQETPPVGDFDSLATALIALAGENKE